MLMTTTKGRNTKWLVRGPEWQILYAVINNNKDREDVPAKCFQMTDVCPKGTEKESSRTAWVWKPLSSFMISVKLHYLGFAWTCSLFFFSFLPFSPSSCKVLYIFPKFLLIYLLGYLSSPQRFHCYCQVENSQVSTSSSYLSSEFITHFLLEISMDWPLDTLYFATPKSNYDFTLKSIFLTCPLFDRCWNHNFPSLDIPCLFLSFNQLAIPVDSSSEMSFCCILITCLWSSS